MAFKLKRGALSTHVPLCRPNSRTRRHTVPIDIESIDTFMDRLRRIPLGSMTVAPAGPGWPLWAAIGSVMADDLVATSSMLRTSHECAKARRLLAMSKVTSY
jgi:hypothetical protein